MASSMDYLICDNGGILDEYSKFHCCKKIKKTVIPYGTYQAKALDSNYPSPVKEYYDKYSLVPNEYYLILGRLVPENNYDLMLSEILKYKGNKKFLIICNVGKENKYFQKLSKKFDLGKNKNIVFAGELYDQTILSYLRQNAFAYIHGHSVGGTNPGLLEAMSHTNLNILFDCVFNREVGKDAALYFDKKNHQLADIMYFVENLTDDEIDNLGRASKNNMAHNYSWEIIVDLYSKLFNCF